jgi:shikimate kinase
VGRRLAENLGWSFVDTDSLVVKQHQMSIKEIVGAHGWEKFRQMEHAMLKSVCASQRKIVATGGGIVLNDQNVTLMRQSGNIIWLRAGIDTIKARMLEDESSQDFRPALTLNDSLSEIEETLQAREPLYQKAMDFFIDTDDHDIRVITNIIIEKLNSIYPNQWETK